MPVAQTRLETLQVCKLLQCVREEDRLQIEKLTSSGVAHLINYNEPSSGETALSTAAIANNDDMIDFLLSLGAHPDVCDFKGRSVAMRAAEYGHVQCLERLLKADADLKTKDREGKNILFYVITATQRHQACAELVLKHGANVNIVSKEGTPVFLAACETALENEELCIRLLKKGADPNSTHQKIQRTALMAASASGSVKVVKAILLRGGEVNRLTTRSKLHAAHEAARAGSLPILASLAAYGAQFEQINDQGNTPIHFAAMAGYGVCCKFLSQRGCNPKHKNSEGLTAQVAAKDLGHKEAVKECRKAAKSFGKSGKNNDPWMLQLYDFSYERSDQLMDMFRAADTDTSGTLPKDEFLDVLRTAGAPLPEDDPNELKKLVTQLDKNKNQTVDYSDFIVAKKWINKQYLMSAFEGKKKKKKKGGKGRKKGKTKILMPICTRNEGDRAADGGPPESFIERHIHFTDSERFDRDRPPTHPLQDDSAWYLQSPDLTYININDSAKHSDLDSLKEALRKGHNLDTKDKFYKTPLMIACNYGNTEVVKFLLENGADVMAKDNFKWTPLHFACHAGQRDLVEILLEKGAQLEAVSLNGATPLMRAIESSKEEVVRLLIEKGAKVQIENRKGLNPVDKAVSWADPRVFDCVKAKWDSLPPINDKKKGAKKGGSNKRPASVPPPSSKEAKTGGARPGSPQFNGLDLSPTRKGSILRAASALAGGLEEREDVTYRPRGRLWAPQPTTEHLVDRRRQRRQHFGWEVDFHDFKMPFLANVRDRMELNGGFDEDD